MPWRFVGRAEEIDRIRAALNEVAPGPIVINGESGMGRTAVLARALDLVDGERDAVIRVEPAGDAPLSALRAHLPDDLRDRILRDAAFGDAVSAAASALAERAGGRRLVVAFDDAHLADHASLLALRTLSRQGTAVLVATRSTSPWPDGRLDPTDCLRYEREMRTVNLSPLSRDEVAAVLAAVVGGHVHPATTEAMHAATGGNPRRLHDLVVGNRLAESMVVDGGMWRLGAGPGSVLAAGRVDIAKLVEAVGNAWRELAVDRADELCRLALWHGVGDQVADAWVNVLLLRGRAAEGLRFLDALPDGRADTSVELVLGRAMTLAFGLGRPAAASEFLLRSCNRMPALRDRLLAYRAWIIAVTGRPAKAAEVLAGVEKSDRETAVFVHATRAAVALVRNSGNEAVFHLRRAVVAAETCHGIPPWMPPYLTACLIDAMLLAGRIGEATAIANGFHAGEPGSGWEIAVTLSALAAGRGQRNKAAARRVTTEHEGTGAKLSTAGSDDTRARLISSTVMSAPSR
ncbi:MAG TPA: ATP-binding protein [Streptosporangiaceae bacterium]|nr:ATP-binding protein [Streptosporangiaceae bacterium]